MKKKLIIALITIAAISISAIVIYRYYNNNNFINYTSSGMAIYGHKSSLPWERLKTAGLNSKDGGIRNFVALDHNGVHHELYRYQNKKAVVIYSHGNDCPIVQKYTSTLNSLFEKYSKKDVIFLGLNSNPQDDRTKISKEVSLYGLKIPILLDKSQLIADLLKIKRTGEAIVLDPSSWKIIYRGSIDDRIGYGIDKQIAQNNYLEDVLNRITSGNKPDFFQTEVKGCLITFPTNENFLYEYDVGTTLVKRCFICHNETSAIPPYFKNYQSLLGWKEMIHETILTERMPPWSSDPHYSTFRNDFSLKQEQKRTLIKWLEAGMPRAANSKMDPLEIAEAARKKRFGSEFPPPLSFGKEVYKVENQENTVPPNGEIEYKYYQAGGPAPKDMWVSGIKVDSTNPRTIHHASMMITSKPISFYHNLSDGLRNENLVNKSQDGNIPLWLLLAIGKYEFNHNEENFVRTQIFASGKNKFAYLSDYRKNWALFIPKGSYIILEMHYMGTGKPEKEQLNITFYEYKKNSTTKKLRTRSSADLEFEIPPNDPNFINVTPEITMKRNGAITGFLSHMHMRGKSIKTEIIKPNGERKTIISVPNFYYGWQTGNSLILDKEIPFNKGDKLITTCIFDNSKDNPFNPDPNARVPWGQTIDRSEMCIMHIGYY